MVKKLILILSLFIAGCGEPCDADAYNLCVINREGPNDEGYDVNYELLKWTIFLVDSEWDESYPDNPVNLQKLFLATESTLEYVDQISNTLYIRGIYQAKNMKVQGGSCYLHYQIAAHEILHLIADQHEKVEHIVNATHQVPRIYVKWAEKNNLPIEETVEWKMASHTANTCGTPFKFVEAICSHTVEEEVVP